MGQGSKMKTWSELSDTEQGALLLAHHKGKTIQYLRNYVVWVDVVKPSFAANRRYRVKPECVVKEATFYLCEYNKEYLALSVDTYPDKLCKVVVTIVNGEPVSSRLEKV